MEREACVCDHGFERSDLCAEIIINKFYIIIYKIRRQYDIISQIQISSYGERWGVGRGALPNFLSRRRGAGLTAV